MQYGGLLDTLPCRVTPAFIEVNTRQNPYAANTIFALLVATRKTLNSIN